MLGPDRAARLLRALQRKEGETPERSCRLSRRRRSLHDAWSRCRPLHDAGSESAGAIVGSHEGRIDVDAVIHDLSVIFPVSHGLFGTVADIVDFGLGPDDLAVDDTAKAVHRSGIEAVLAERDAFEGKLGSGTGAEKSGAGIRGARSGERRG